MKSTMPARITWQSVLLSLIVLLIPLTLSANNPTEMSDMSNDQFTPEGNQDHLVVLWTSGDPDVALKMVFMYAYNAKKNNWWKDVTFVVWGPSAKLSSENGEISEYLVKMKEIGIEMLACKACADSYGVSPDLEILGIDVKYMGVPLTDYIKEGKKVLTF